MEENGEYECMNASESGLAAMAALITGFYAPCTFRAFVRTF